MEKVDLKDCINPTLLAIQIANEEQARFEHRIKEIEKLRSEDDCE